MLFSRGIRNGNLTRTLKLNPNEDSSYTELAVKGSKCTFVKMITAVTDIVYLTMTCLLLVLVNRYWLVFVLASWI